MAKASMRSITLAVSTAMTLAACFSRSPNPEAVQPAPVPVQSTAPPTSTAPAPVPTVPTPPVGMPTQQDEPGPQAGGLPSTRGGSHAAPAPAPRSGMIPPGSIGAGSSNPAADQVQLTTSAGPECQTDRDCTCGIDRTTGACAVGPSARVDSSRQCPDYCGGIDGRTRTVCARGRCTQSR